MIVSCTLSDVGISNHVVGSNGFFYWVTYAHLIHVFGFIIILFQSPADTGVSHG